MADDGIGDESKPRIRPASQDSGREPLGDRPPPVYRSKDLMKGHREIWIEHGDEMYRLRLTSAGKLYLTK